MRVMSAAQECSSGAPKPGGKFLRFWSCAPLPYQSRMGRSAGMAGASSCEAEGHEVSFVCYTGLEDLSEQLPAKVDLVFIGSFTEAALLAYALSNRFRLQGAVTALGGPHARCYPEDAAKHFDYVLGFTDRAVVRDVLRDCARHRPTGTYLSAQRQPVALPGVRERWKYIELTLRKAPILKIVPMLASLGCPYTCSFCIDSVVPYQAFA